MNMAVRSSGGWNPDWAVHPGELLAEYLEARGWSQAEFARLADLSPKLVSTIIAGKNPISPETAVKLERVLGTRAYIWTGLQARWDVDHARTVDDDAFDACAWLRKFPTKELKERGVLPATKDENVLVDALLSFIGIGAPSAYQAKYASLAVHHRQAKGPASSPEHVLSWLLLGECRVREMDMPQFDEARFQSAVREIRKLTTSEPETFEPKMKALCQSAGVALVFEKPISKTCLFGSARWIDRRAVLQMSLRMKTNDHFWWTFFHEAGHIILHRGQTFLDDKNGEGDGVEKEADAWAEEQLFGCSAVAQLLRNPPRTAEKVKAVAQELDLHAGIVVGMLQHHRKLPFTHLNGLKTRFEWKC